MDRNVNNCTPRHWHTELLTREAGPSGPRPPNGILGSWRARPEYKNSGPAWTRRLWRPLVCTPFWRPPRYAPRRGPIVDATAHERCLRGDGFGDGFGADFSPLGRSTGGDSAPVLPSVARSAGGAPGSLRATCRGFESLLGSSVDPLVHVHAHRTCGLELRKAAEAAVAGAESGRRDLNELPLGPRWSLPASIGHASSCGGTASVRSRQPVRS